MHEQPDRTTPAEEHRTRFARVRQALGHEGLDGLLCYADAWRTANVRYFTDFRPVDGINGIEQALLLIPLDAEPTLIVADGTLGYAEEMTGFEVRSFGELDSLIGRTGAGKRLGLAGAGQIPAVLMARLEQSSGEVVPTQALARLKAVKSVWEVEQLREAARLTDVGMESIRDCILSGRRYSERDLARAADERMIAAGADGVAFLSMVQSGPRSGYSLALPTDRMVEDGDLVLTDVGARYGNYVADGGRGFTLGPIRPEIRAIVDASVDAVQAGLEVVRPGITASELNAAVQQVLVERGYLEYSAEARGRGTGHGTGMDPEEELPWIGPTNHEVLTEGMVFTLKATINVPGVGGLRTEHIVHVGASEACVLDHFPERNHW